MANIRTCNKHNMIACVEKTAQNADFYQIIDFLTGCSINLLSVGFIMILWPHGLQQFWATATLQVINDVPHIRAKVAGKKILVSEATIRADLLFDDENGVDCFPKQVIWDTLRNIGYEGCAKALNSKCCSFSKVPAYLNDPASLLRYASLHWYSYLLEGTAEIQGLLTSNSKVKHQALCREPTPYKQRRRRPRIRRNVFSQIGENKDGKESLSEETQGSRKKIHPQHFFDDTADKDLPVTHCSSK
ncbi:hypothetical protein Tco_0078991 [Tanacetum coccineum]